MAGVITLETVKSMIGVTGNYQDDTIQAYIDEVKQYMLDGGVMQEVVEASTSAGIIARGVTDLWNYGAGEGKLSDYFMQRVIQLAMKKVVPQDPETKVSVARSAESDDTEKWKTLAGKLLERTEKAEKLSEALLREVEKDG